MSELDYETQRLLEKLQKQLQEALDRQNIAYMGDTKVVRIPRISPERLRMLRRESNPEVCSVEYIADTWYDEESRQTRNSKYIIGLIFDDYPMAMIPNDNYFKYFDEATGRPRILPGMRNPAGMAEAKEQKVKKSRGTKAAGANRTSKATDTTGADEAAETTEATETTDGQRIPHHPDSREKPRTPERKKYSAEEDATEEETSDTDNALEDFFAEIERNRREAEAAMIRSAEEEEKRKRNLELYGEQDIGDIERQEAIQSIMALFDDCEKEETGTKDTMKKDAQPETREPAEAPEEAAGKAKEQETSPEETSPQGKADNPELQQTFREYQIAKERQAILGKILNEILASVRNLAKKRPNDIVNEYKANRINRLLKEAISRYEHSGYEDLMELIELPREEEQDGEIVRTGMTYSDLELLLDHYCTILHFIPSGK